MIDLSQKIKQKWQNLEANKSQPSEINKVIEIEYKEFSKLFIENNFKKIEKLIEDFYSGNVFTVKNSFSKEFFEKVKTYLINNFDNVEPIFYKTKEGCPNFHMIIGDNENAKYAVKSNRHDYYFFSWNRDKEKIDFFDYFYPKWRLIKLLAGLRMNEFEKNTPKDGPIDRLLFRSYPNNTGFLGMHTDPLTIRVISGIIMSKKGEDFDNGGLFFLKNNKPLNVENFLDVGDIVLCYPTLKHGVETIKNKDPNKKRWWACLTNPISDEVNKRAVQKSY